MKTPLAAAVENRLGRYCAMGLGTAVIAGVVTTTDASVAYTNYNSLLLNDTITTDTLATTYGFDVDGNGTQDFRFQVRNEGSSSTSNFAIIVAGVASSALKPIDVVGTSQGKYGYPSRLGAGVSISAAQPFVTLSLTASSTYLKAGTFAFGNGFTHSKWKTAGSNSGYLGIRFSAADGMHYGFVQMSVAPQGSGANSRAITLNGIGYQTTPGMAITTFAAPVPEPSSVALLALGPIGLAAYRRRRKAGLAPAVK